MDEVLENRAYMQKNYCLLQCITTHLMTNVCTHKLGNRMELLSNDGSGICTLSFCIHYNKEIIINYSNR